MDKELADKDTVDKELVDKEHAILNIRGSSHSQELDLRLLS